MESKDKLKEIVIKNDLCYYLDDIIGFMDRYSDFYFNDILLDEKLCKEKDENVLIDDVSFKTSSNVKSFSNRFNKIDGFIKTHNSSRCLVLFDIGGLIKFAIGLNIL